MKSKPLHPLVLILALIGGVYIFLGIWPKTRVEIQPGGYIAIVESSWWGLSQTELELGLVHFDDFKDGPPYQPLEIPEDCDWYVKDGDEWRSIGWPDHELPLQ